MVGYWKGKKLPEEIKLKLSLSHKGLKNNLGNKHSEKTKLKISLSKKGCKTWNKGILMTGEAKIKLIKNHKGMVGKKQSKYQKQIMSKIHKGKIVSEESKRKMSISAVAQLRKTPLNNKMGYREDLHQYFRSKFEANYARFLKWFGVQYEYETDKCVFKLSNGRNYICDFYLPEIEQYIEIKGWLKDKAKEKLELFQKEYVVKWRMITQKSEEWKQITKDYGKLILNWEKE